MQSFAAENDEDVILDLQIMKFSRKIIYIYKDVDNFICLANQYKVLYYKLAVRENLQFVGEKSHF